MADNLPDGELDDEVLDKIWDNLNLEESTNPARLTWSAADVEVEPEPKETERARIRKALRGE